jgi:hypothetical protein
MALFFHQEHVMWQLVVLFAGVAVCGIFGCKQYNPPPPAASGQGSAASGQTSAASGQARAASGQASLSAAQGTSAAAFLDAKKQVPSRREWNKEVGSRQGGAISFRVTSQGPFAVTVITDRGRKALLGGGKMMREDGLFTIDSKAPTFEGKVMLPPGSSWFIIENQANQTVEIHLECFAAG